MSQMSLVEKLNPGKFSGISGKMSALVGCILGEQFTEPYFAELTVTSDGMVLARMHWDIGFNEFIGSISDFRDNWKRLLDVAELTDEEKVEANRLFSERVGTEP